MDFINQEYLFSPIRCVPILTLSPALNWGLDDNCSISPCRLKYTVLSFFFLLASIFYGCHFNGTVLSFIILLKGQMNEKIDIFSFVALPSPNTKKKHPKCDLGKDFSFQAFIER